RGTFGQMAAPLAQGADRAVAHVIASSEDEEGLYAQVLAAMGTALDCKLGAAWEHDTTGTLVCAETWYAPGFAGADFVEVTRGFRYAHGAGLTGLVGTIGAPVWIVC